MRPLTLQPLPALQPLDGARATYRKLCRDKSKRAPALPTKAAPQDSLNRKIRSTCDLLNNKPSL